jgi:hypothetical protein
LNDKRRDGDRESRRILDRVNTQMGASASRGGDDRSDWPEYWGKRIGRTLGMIFLLVVVYWLYQMVSGTG